jgi:hypothetical protein
VKRLLPESNGKRKLTLGGPHITSSAMKQPFGIRAAAGIISLPLAIAAQSESARSQGTGPEALASLKSTAAYRKTFPAGTETNEFVRLLGSPDSREVFHNATNVTTWLYFVPPFPADDEMRGTYVTSVSPVFTNGRLWRINFSYTEGPTETVRKENLPRVSTNAVVPLKFFTVKERQFAGARLIDTPTLPKLGYVAANPDMEVHRLSDLELREEVRTDSESKRHTNWVFSIWLIPDDVERFEALTTANLGRRILIAVGDRPIIAPMVRATISQGHVDLTCPPDEQHRLKAELARLKRDPAPPRIE